jgi:hypothetical protein
VPLAPEPGAEAALSQWLTQAWPDRRSAVRCDDEHITGQSLAFEVEHVDLLECVVSGLRIAFHARQYGRLLGGLPGVREVPRADDARHWIDVNGLVRLEGGSVVGGRVIRDRLGLKARLTQEVCR